MWISGDLLSFPGTSGVSGVDEKAVAIEKDICPVTFPPSSSTPVARKVSDEQKLPKAD